MSGIWRRLPLLAAWLAVVVSGCLATGAAAQSPTTGALTGIVQGASGDELPEALVTLRDTASGTQRTAFTNRRGTFAFPFLAPGDYELFIEKIGFAPRRLTGIPVRPGRELEIVATLETGNGADQEAGVQRMDAAALAGGRPGASQWLSEFGIRHLPARQRTLVELTRLASTADETNTVEGLPASLSTLVLDGTVFRPAAGTALMDGRRWTNAFALSSAQSAQLMTNGVDVEWGDAAAGFLSVHTRRGTEAARVEGAGYWSGSAIQSGSSIDTGSQSFNDMQGGFVLRGPVMSDSARFTLGVDARQLETPLSSAWADTPAIVALVGAGAPGGLNLDRYLEPGITQHRSISGFARLDWAVAGRHQLEVSSQFATMPESELRLPGTMPPLEGRDIVLGAAARSSLAEASDNELRVAITSSRRASAGGDSVPFTMLAQEALRFGAEAQIYRAEETLIRVSDALHYRAGSHTFKVGAGFTYGSYVYDNQPDPRGVYAFGDVDQLIAGTGSFSRIEGPAAFADWSNQTITLFAQDRWSADAGLDVVIGVRAERETLPSHVQRDARWFQLTGLANDDAGAQWRVAPRIGITWDAGRANAWTAQASGGVYYDRFDPLLLAQWQTDDGTNDVRRVVGTITWPDAGTGAGTTAPRLTMLGPEFQAPRTARVSAGISRRLGGSTAVHVGGVFRRTENLPRRRDLNLIQLPAFTDQSGRAVYGTLIKQGALLSATPASSRRFTEYDEVAALSADGWSDHFGITVGAERELNGALGILARYTYGRTTDNWFGAARGGWMASPPAGLDDNWSEGSSDFDRPHRAVAGVVMNVVAGMRVAALYRMQSGLPFTPGFRPGVDANADDVAGNDPAFIDEALAGMDALMREWPCLRASAGRMAARNSCRSEPTHALDLSLSVRVVRFGAASTSLVADVFDMLESSEKMPDAALYLVDPAASLVTDATARTVTVPLLVNPDFGQPLTSRESGRRIRLGISLNW